MNVGFDIRFLLHWIAANYDIKRPIAASLLRAYTNDVYVVNAGGDHFILKMYRRDWRTEGEVRYEAALLRHLAKKGARVMPAIPGSDGDAVRIVTVESGPQCAVLFAYAPGDKPHPPFTVPLYESFGQAIAQMHTLSDDFVTDYPRRPLTLELLIQEPLTRLLPLVETTEDRTFFQETALWVQRGLSALAPAPLDWGPIHGDATLDNLHVTADGEIILYDFDSGGPGWRAADLQGWALGDSSSSDNSWGVFGEAFRRGYSHVRPLHEADIHAARYLTVAWDFWGIGIDLEHRILDQGAEPARAYLRERKTALQERRRALSL